MLLFQSSRVHYCSIYAAVLIDKSMNNDAFGCFPGAVSGFLWMGPVSGVVACCLVLCCVVALLLYFLKIENGERKWRENRMWMTNHFQTQ